MEKSYQSSTLRPGLLVSLKTSIAGNVRYTKIELEADHKTESGERKARWETQRLITDPDEHEAARKVRSRASSLIRGSCAHSAFGLLCPEDKADVLDKAVAEARALADEFNKSARLSRVYLYVIAGRIASDDVEAVKAINSEVRDLLDEMKEGVENLDVKAIRDAAGRAKSLGSMLSPDAAARIQIAIDTARATAKKIVQAGEEGAAEIDRAAIKKITESRTAFLDLDGGGDISTPRATGRALDLSPDVEKWAEQQRKTKVPFLEIDED